MLGYKGLSDRREFAAGAALTLVAPVALSMAIKGSIAGAFAAFPKTVALMLAIALTVLVCVAIVVWFWGWSVLLTRRARDIGLPAWVGVASVVVLGACLSSVKAFASPDVYGWISVAAFTAWTVGWMAWPSRGGAFLPPRARTSAAGQRSAAG